MDTGEKLYIRNSWGNKDIVMLRTGEVGIGTATPATNLHVEGNTSGTHTTLRLKNLNTTAGIGAQIQLYDHDSFFYQTIVNGDLRFYNGVMSF